jgi:hypothetical protein
MPARDPVNWTRSEALDSLARRAHAPSALSTAPLGRRDSYGRKTVTTKIGRIELAIIAETMGPSMMASYVARRLLLGETVKGV